MMDYGCGSAILALAALRFGAARAAGIDIDRDSLVSARRNCDANGEDIFIKRSLRPGDRSRPVLPAP